MPYDLKIPEYKALDLSGATTIADSYYGAKKQKQDQERLSAEEARKAYDHAHTLDKERADLFKEGSDFWTAAKMSTGAGNQVGAPWGVTVGEYMGKDAAPDRATPSTAEAAQYLKNGGISLEKGETDPLLTADHASHPAAGELQPLQGPTPTGEPLHTQDPGMPTPGTAAAPAAEIDPEAEFDARDKKNPVTRHYYAQVNGQRIEAPKEQPIDYFDEPAYNAQAERLRADSNGKLTAEQAIKQVAADRKVNIGEYGKTDRFNKGLGFKEAHTQTVAEQRAALKARLDQSDLNNRRTANAHIEGDRILAGAGHGLPGTKENNSYLSFVKEATAASGAKIDQMGMRNHDRIAAELDGGDPSAVLQQTAYHTLTAMSLSASGGSARVLKSAIDDIQAAPGLINSAKNQMYRAWNGGQNMPEIVDMYRHAADVLRKVGEIQAERDFRAIDAKVGRNSPFYRNSDAAMRDMVDSQMDGVRINLGLQPFAGGDGGAAGLGGDGLSPDEMGGAPGPAPAPGPSRPAPQRHAGGGGADHNAAITWARAHKGSPKAKVILQMNGLTE